MIVSFLLRAGLLSLLALTVNGSLARASTITLTFDVNVWNEHNYATNTDTPLALDTTMKVSFDDGVTGVETDSTDYLVQYGLPVISSPLTATLPYAPTPGPPPPSSEVALDNRDYGPSQQWSELAIVESQDTLQPGFTTWVYDFDLDSGAQSPLNPNPAQNGTSALYSQLVAYLQNQTDFTFEEFGYQYNTQTGQDLTGLGYDATAFITDVQQAPDPSTFAMVSAAAVALFALKRRYRS